MTTTVYNKSEKNPSKKGLGVFYCELCDHQSSRAGDFKKHNQSMKHRRKAGDEPQQKQPYSCESCNYITDRKSNYELHMKSEKHLDTINYKVVSKTVCQHCNKAYSGANNLWKHLKICKEIKKEEEKIQEDDQYESQEDALYGSHDEDDQKGEEQDDNEDEEKHCDISSQTSSQKINLKEVVYEFMKVIQKSDEVKVLLIKQNEEFKQHMMEMSKQQMTITNNTNSNNTNTTNNTQFNLQFFLNEQCKNAINIMDFVNSLNIQVSDLEETGKLGFIDGITRIFANGLRELDIYRRPIHCTDLKRETLYVKDEDTWEKEEEGKPRLKKAINRVSNMNLKQLKRWQELNPGYDDVDTATNDMFIHLSTQAIGACSSQENDRNIDKIMKNLCRQVALDKKDGSLVAR